MADVFIKDEPVGGASNHVGDERLGSLMFDKNSHLDHLISHGSTEQLENGVMIGKRFLETLSLPLTPALAGDTQAAQWLEAIQQLQNKSEPSQTVIGVVGNTGAGKSSLINAMLNEESLVPTNGMRACTASATEISWNHSGDPAQRYRAEVDFIAQEDWAIELRNLFQDLLDGTGRVSSDCNNPDTEAGLAYAKIKAVYPHHPKALLSRCIPDQMAQETAISDTLGSVKYLAAADASTLFNELQQYVDSKEKGTAEETRMEYWPLIKVVRIYCKASVLETGAIIVDLPGVQDSNAARAAVAAKYLQLCTGIYITAAIQRAVDDKAAKVLLGDSFKHQIRFDGTYSAITFICTKTDDILVSEVSHSLSLEEELREEWQHIESLQDEQKQQKQQLGELKEELCAVDDQIENLDADEEKWQELASKLEDGEAVYKPNTESPKKRKRKLGLSNPRKRHNNMDESSDTESGYEPGINDGNDGHLDRSGSNEHEHPLTSGEIAAELSKIKAQKKDLRKSKKSVKEHVSKIKKQLSTLNNEEKTVRSEIKSICVKRRNEYSRAAIKNEFAKGIKELDQEAAMADDEANFNPEEDIRDYEEVAQTLPVFCVSARAYQKLSGRLQKDIVQVDGFALVNDTEVPNLQEHTRRLTEAGRANKYRRFLNDLDHLLNSMKLWARSDTGALLSKEQQKEDEVFVRVQLASLKRNLHEAVVAHATTFRTELAEKIYSAFERAIPKATAKAVATANSWGTHESGTSLHYGTYKATTRRSGAFRRKDFNAELLDPVFRRLSGPWERVFQLTLPSLLKDLAKLCKEDTSKFHSDATAGVRADPFSLVILQQQLCAAIRFLDTALIDLRQEISGQQREANRGFLPIIQQAMQHAYDICVAESGSGSYMRMRNAMISHVEEVRHTMFRQACQTVRQDLDRMCATLEAAMHELVSEFYTRMKRDCLSVLVKGDIPDSEKKLRSSMREDLFDADAWFNNIPGEDVVTYIASVPESDAVDQREGMTAPSEHEGEDDHQHTMSDHLNQESNGAQDVLAGTTLVTVPTPMWM